MPPPLPAEDRLVRWLQRTLPAGDLIGDDAALLPADAWAVTMDTQIEGVHLPSRPDPAVTARRLLAVNLSDLAAMGAVPAYAFLSLSAPAGFDRRRFFRAWRSAAQRYDVRLAGGDLSQQPYLSTALTLMGRRTRRGRWLTRDAARPGHHIWVGGTLGEAALGLRLIQAGADVVGRSVRLPSWVDRARMVTVARRAVRRHVQPQPQIELGQWLAKETPEGAAIDISDGFARDLHRLCRASRVGATIDRNALPVPHGTATIANKLGASIDSLAQFGGEDYVLLFTLPPAIEPPPAMECQRVGVVRARRDVKIRHDGVTQLLPDQGWDHLEGKATPTVDRTHP